MTRLCFSVAVSIILLLAYCWAIPVEDDGQVKREGKRVFRRQEGSPGQKGEPGDPGQPGVPGERGISGPQGEQGDRGPSGPVGPPGDRGAVGPAGAKGDRGDLGPFGAKGDQGDKGERGESGGERGPKGEPGVTGPPGNRGERGADGLNGLVGPPGRDGNTGDRGRQGAQGVPGNDGVSGEPGRPGVDGRNGAEGGLGLPGGSGPKGDPGSPGPTGPPGPPALPILNGTPAPPGQPDSLGSKSSGSIYVRWGRTNCPNITGSALVYRGRAAGSHYTNSGGGSKFQCLTEDPENFDYGPSSARASYIYGAEYETVGNVPLSNLPLQNHNVPCAVCYVATRATVLMIPGKYTCPENWTREYYGYLMSERHSHYRSTFECVDVAPEGVPGGESNENGALFYHVEPRRGSLPFPPYRAEKEITCAVCTR